MHWRHCSLVLSHWCRVFLYRDGSIQLDILSICWCSQRHYWVYYKLHMSHPVILFWWHSWLLAGKVILQLPVLMTFSLALTCCRTVYWKGLLNFNDFRRCQYLCLFPILNVNGIISWNELTLQMQGLGYSLGTRSMPCLLITWLERMAMLCNMYPSKNHM